MYEHKFNIATGSNGKDVCKKKIALQQEVPQSGISKSD